MTKSASAGTWMGWLTAGTKETDFFRKNPANMYSSIPSGNGAVAANAFAGSPPNATATGIGLPISWYFFPCLAPTLCNCQCNAASHDPNTCIRYIPTFLSFVSGSSVITWGNVRKGPPSLGHVFRTGRSPRPRPPSSTLFTTS